MGNDWDGFKRQMIAYAEKFYTELSKKDTYGLLVFNKRNLGNFEKTFDKQMEKISSRMRQGCTPDRHKIIAASVKSFIKEEVFSFNKNKHNALKKQNKFNESDLIDIRILLPNELYLIDMIAFFCNRYGEDRLQLDGGYNLRLPDSICDSVVMNKGKDYIHVYAIDLVILFRLYSLEKLEFPVQELAHIIFFLEMGYEITVHNLKNRYYTI